MLDARDPFWPCRHWPNWMAMGLDRESLTSTSNGKKGLMKSTLRQSLYKLLLFLLAAFVSLAPAKGATASTVAGMQDGWAVDPGTDAVLLTAAKAQEIAGGSGKWVRVPFR